MGGGHETSTVANEAQLKDFLSIPSQNAEILKPLSPFSREFSSTFRHKPLQEVHTTPRKRATLTPEDFLAHAFGPDFAVSVNRKGGSESVCSSPIEAPGTPSLDGSSSGSSRRSSTSGRTKSRSQKSEDSGGVLPKAPPRGTFSSARRSSKPKKIASPPSSSPPHLQATDPPASQHQKDIPSHLLYVQDDPKLEPFMTPEEWKGNSERRIQRRQLRKLAFAIDVDCSPNQLPLDIDCRPIGWSMGLGLAPIDEDNFERHKRGRSPASNPLDGFWPTCETPEHVDEDQFSSNPATPESSTIDISDLENRCSAMSVGSSTNPSRK